jgi:hypothetical protein
MKGLRLHRRVVAAYDDEPASVLLEPLRVVGQQRERPRVDCGEILQATQDAMLRRSELSLMLAAVCTEACEKLALSCRSLDRSDPQLTACVEACEVTAESCRQLAV